MSKNAQTDELKRLRASAQLALKLEVPKARKQLEAIVTGGGDEATDAALALVTHAGVRGLQWSDVAEKHLKKAHHEFTLSLKAMNLAERGHYKEGRQLLRRYKTEEWALKSLFDMACFHGDMDEAKNLVDDVLASNPDRPMRLACADVLSETGGAKRAVAEARAITQDRSATREQRARGYVSLIRALLADRRPKDASKELDQWRELNPSDPVLGLWMARVGSRKRAAKERARR